MAKDFVAVFVILLCLAVSGARKAKQRLRSGATPLMNSNIIFILTDDQDSELGSPNVMIKMQKILREEGAHFVNAFVTTPMCCPSRASILTGTYVHNHNTFTNNLNCSSLAWRKGPERKSFARYLQETGYVTGYFGKYLNEYDGSYVPVGYNRWEGLVHNSRFYNYSIRHNSYLQRHRTSYEHDYFTDLITNDTIGFIRHAKSTKPNSPFMAVMSHAAPHGPETAAPQYSEAFPDARAPRFPNWNFCSQDKQWILRRTPPMSAQKMDFVDLLHRKRLQTLLSVDDSIERIFSTLQSLEIENETYIFFTSDHGYHLGQFGLVKGKSMPFESDVRVPFYVRGPSIPKNIRMKEMVLNIDLAPTFLDIANVRIPKDMDGTSIMKLFRKTRDGRRGKRRTNVAWRDTFLIERSRGWKRTKNFLEGKSGNKTQSKKPRKLSVLENLCTQPKYLSPCKADQLWECVTVDNRPRLRKCRRNVTIQVTTAPPTSPTTSAKMCVCMKLRPEMQTEDQDDFDDDLFPSGFLDQFTRETRRRSKRSRSYAGKMKRRGSEFNPRRYYKELARAAKLQNRRAKSKALIRTSTTVPKEKEKTDTSELLLGPYEPFDVPEEVEERLGKLNEKIQGIRQRLEALRDRKKKLLLLSARDRLIEYSCPCNEWNGTTPASPIGESLDDGVGEFTEENDEPDTSPLKRRSKLTKVIARKSEGKKKKTKTNPRRTICATPGVNCFYQTNDHWKLPPLWQGGEFCFCPNAANNSYHCLRTINATHNFLYCEFITHFVEYFDLNRDPYQLYNTVHEINPAVLYELQQQLHRMKACKGEGCTHYHGKKYVPAPTSSPEMTTRATPTTRVTPINTDAKTESTENVRYPNTTEGTLVILNKTQLPNVRNSSESSEDSSEASVKPTASTVSTLKSPMVSSLTTSAPTEAKAPTVRNSKRRKSQSSSNNGNGEKDTRKSSKKIKKSKKKSSSKEMTLLNVEMSQNKTRAEVERPSQSASLPVDPVEPSEGVGKVSGGVANRTGEVNNSSEITPSSSEKESQKSTKKLRKSKKKSLGKGNSSLSSGAKVDEVVGNKTSVAEKTRKSGRSKSNRNLENGNSESERENRDENQEETSRESLRKPNNKPTTRRENRKSKRRSRHRTTPKRTKSAGVDEGNNDPADEGENSTVFPFVEEASPSDP